MLRSDWGSKEVKRGEGAGDSPHVPWGSGQREKSIQQEAGGALRIVLARAGVAAWSVCLLAKTKERKSYEYVYQCGSAGASGRV
jgi:hypothetical protein